MERRYLGYGPHIRVLYACWSFLENRKTEFGNSRNQLYDKLKKFNIFTRKYFYPLCSQLQCYRNLPSAAPENLPVAEHISQNVLSLPLFGGLQEDDIHRICDTIQYIQEF